MAYRIFVSFARGDDAWAAQLYESVSRLENVEVYVPDWVNVEGKNVGHEVKNGLDISHVVIILITFNSTNTIWLNQQIGYAFAKNIPIILVVEKGIDVKGFLEESDFITYQRGDFKQNICEIISKLRAISSQCLLDLPVGRFFVTCTTCGKKFPEALPAPDMIVQKVNSGQALACRCPFCSAHIDIEPATLSPIVQ